MLVWEWRLFGKTKINDPTIRKLQSDPLGNFKSLQAKKHYQFAVTLPKMRNWCLDDSGHIYGDRRLRVGVREQKAHPTFHL